MRRVLALLATAVTAGVLAGPALSAPGALDPAFGSGGIVTTSLGSNGAQGFAVAQQADGKLVVAAAYDISSTDMFISDLVAVLRYLPDGTLDPSFGSGGVVYPSADRGGNIVLALAPDGKIVLARSLGIGTSDLAVLRLNADGTTDTSFGTGGQFVWDSGGSDYPDAVAVQPDDKIVVVDTSGGETAVLRLATDGTLDSAFGSGGIAAGSGAGVSSFLGSAVAIQTDGKIVVGGAGAQESRRPGADEQPPPASDSFALMRLLPDGSLDQSFGSFTVPLCDCFLHGYVFTGVGSQGGINHIALQADGAIVAAGSAGDVACAGTSVVARYDTYGNLDPTFGDQGIATLAAPRVETDAMSDAVQPDGKVVVVGFAADMGADCVVTSVEFLVQRLNADGTPDTGFGVGGVVETPVGAYALAYDGILQADGKIVAVGFGSGSVAVVRWLGDSPAAQVASMRADVDAAGLPRPVQSLLDALLQAASRAVDRRQTPAACATTHAFRLAVGAARKSMSLVLYTELLARDAELRAGLGCGG